MKRTALILTLIVIAVAGIWIYPAATFRIDDSWWIVRYMNERDPYSASLIQESYGGTIIDIDAGHDFNTFGQSFLFVGGSRAFARELPWAEEVPPALEVAKPTTQPNVKWIIEDWDTAHIQTPKGSFYVYRNQKVADGMAHDYGMITKAYDVQRRRWIILCVGYTGYCTGAGATIIVQEPQLLQTHSWIVYEWLGGEVSTNAWSLSAFSNYDIVATG
jgi:hypothetical protein